MLRAEALVSLLPRAETVESLVVPRDDALCDSRKATCCASPSVALRVMSKGSSAGCQFIMSASARSSLGMLVLVLVVLG